MVTESGVKNKACFCEAQGRGLRAAPVTRVCGTCQLRQMSWDCRSGSDLSADTKCSGTWCPAHLCLSASVRSRPENDHYCLTSVREEHSLFSSSSLMFTSLHPSHARLCSFTLLLKQQMCLAGLLQY